MESERAGCTLFSVLISSSMSASLDVHPKFNKSQCKKVNLPFLGGTEELRLKFKSSYTNIVVICFNLTQFFYSPFVLHPLLCLLNFSFSCSENCFSCCRACTAHTYARTIEIGHRMFIWDSHNRELFAVKRKRGLALNIGTTRVSRNFAPSPSDRRLTD